MCDTGDARAVSDAPVMATLVARPGGGGEAPETAGGRLLQWLPDGSLLTVLVPSDRGPEPVEPAVPICADHPAQPRQGDADRDAALPAPHRARRAAVQALHDRAARDRGAGTRAAADRHAGDVSRLLGEPGRQPHPARDDRRSAVVHGRLQRLRQTARRDRSSTAACWRTSGSGRCRKRSHAARTPARTLYPARSSGGRTAKGLSLLWRESERRRSGRGRGGRPGSPDAARAAVRPGARPDDRLDRASHQQRALRQGRALRVHDPGQAQPGCRRRTPRGSRRLRSHRSGAGEVRAQSEHRSG